MPQFEIVDIAAADCEESFQIGELYLKPHLRLSFWLTYDALPGTCIIFFTANLC